jgi:hypothetical protein
VGLEEGCGEMQNGGGASLAGFACNPRRRVVERQREGKNGPDGHGSGFKRQGASLTRQTRQGCRERHPRWGSRPWRCQVVLHACAVRGWCEGGPARGRVRAWRPRGVGACPGRGAAG